MDCSNILSYCNGHEITIPTNYERYEMSIYLNAEVSPDGSGGRVLGVGLSEHDPPGLDDVESLPHHGQHWAGRHVLDESGEERLLRQVSVVVLQVLLGRLEKQETV